MSDAPRARDMIRLWQAQPAAAGTLSIAELRRRSRRLERLVGWRNLSEYIGAAIGVCGFSIGAWSAETGVIRAGALLLVIAPAFIAYQLYRRGSVRRMPEALALTGSLQFHRSELERQRDLLRSVWLWYLLPWLPGAVVLSAGLAAAHPERIPGMRIYLMSVALLAVAVALLNRRGASRIQAWLDALERE